MAEVTAPVEQDTIENEDIEDLLSFVVPAEPARSAPLFGVLYSRAVFEGWVKQPSACCGASAVAGAYNAIHGQKRNDRLALNHEHVLDIYRDIMKERLNKRQSSFERKSGLIFPDSFWVFFDQFSSRETSGKKKPIGKIKLNFILNSMHSQVVESATQESTALVCFLGALKEMMGTETTAQETVATEEEVPCRLYFYSVCCSYANNKHLMLLNFSRIRRARKKRKRRRRGSRRQTGTGEQTS